MSLFPVLRNDSFFPTRNLFDSILDDWAFGPLVTRDQVNDLNLTTKVKTNVVDLEKEYRIDIVIPGVSRDDIVVDVDEKDITVSYEAKEQTESSVSYSSFKKQWKLPQNVNIEDIVANYNQGILSISVPKNVKAVAPSRRLEIG
tara:strand:- start:1489 stop:1920 length:432 start_codon:yes stop_codon:yes gene_type:complete